MFEIVSPYNRIVVPYEEIAIYHIGTRDNITLNEIEIDIGIPKPKEYNCKNLTDLIEMASKLRYCEEGYVVKDKDYRRVEVNISKLRSRLGNLFQCVNDILISEVLCKTFDTRKDFALFATKTKFPTFFFLIMMVR